MDSLYTVISLMEQDCFMALLTFKMHTIPFLFTLLIANIYVLNLMASFIATKAFPMVFLQHQESLQNY